MSKPKKQHYVPQFLLRNFSPEQSSGAKVWALDKRTQKVYQSSVLNVAHENQFYEHHDEAEDIELEDLMQRNDSRGAEIISSITSTRRFPGSPEERIWLSYFVVAQMLRTPVTRNDMEHFRKMIISKWGPDIRAHPEDPKTMGEYGPQDAKASSLRIISEVPKFAEMLQDKVWCLCAAPPAVPYIISDNPVARHNMIERPQRGNLGLRNEGIEVYMPLSPSLTIHATCPKLALAALMTPQLSTQYARALSEGTPMTHAPENAEFSNSLQVIWAERFVYAKDRESLEMPLDMLRTNPELKEGPGVRQRIEEV